jgi:hypothetical protein
MQHAGRLQLDLHLAEVGNGRIRAIERAIRRGRSGPSGQENADSRRSVKSILSAQTALRRYCNRQGERSAQVLSAAVVQDQGGLMKKLGFATRPLPMNYTTLFCS